VQTHRGLALQRRRSQIYYDRANDERDGGRRAGSVRSLRGAA